MPKRSTRAAIRGRTKLTQNTLANEESDVEDMDRQSNISEESHKENIDEDESVEKAAKSSAKGLFSYIFTNFFITCIYLLA